MFDTIAEVISVYTDNPETHTQIWNEFLKNVNNTPTLKKHRDFVEKGKYGYGDRPFHWMWKLLIDQMPENFSMLEIGVFQGQTVSLASLLAKETNKKAKVVGVTPLDQTGDQYATHPNYDYLTRIRELHINFGLPSPMILRGLSFDPRVQRIAKEEGPYDLVYIDGCHDYDVVVDDIEVYAPLVKDGGYLLIDDAGCDLSIPPGLIRLDWKGLADVTRAVNDCLPDLIYNHCGMASFEHCFAVGHNRVFRRVA